MTNLSVTSHNIASQHKLGNVHILVSLGSTGTTLARDSAVGDVSGVSAGILITALPKGSGASAVSGMSGTFPSSISFGSFGGEADADTSGAFSYRCLHRFQHPAD